MNAHAAALQVLASHVAGRNISEVLAEMDDAPPRQETEARPLAVASVAKRFKSRPYQRSPDREASRQRRARLAADYDAMPPQIRLLLQEAGAAVATVIAREQQCHGRCELHVETIAALAGVSVRSVQYTRARLKELDLITFEERPITDPAGHHRVAKSRTNIIQIVAADWVDHLAKKRAAKPGCKTFPARKIVQATKTQSIRGQTEQVPVEPVERQHGLQGKREEPPSHRGRDSEQLKKALGAVSAAESQAGKLSAVSAAGEVLGRLKSRWNAIAWEGAMHHVVTFAIDEGLGEDEVWREVEEGIARGAILAANQRRVGKTTFVVREFIRPASNREAFA